LRIHAFETLSGFVCAAASAGTVKTKARTQAASRFKRALPGRAGDYAKVDPAGRHSPRTDTALAAAVAWGLSDLLALGIKEFAEEPGKSAVA
jgi:hypothetical protein